MPEIDAKIQSQRYVVLPEIPEPGDTSKNTEPINRS